MKSYVILLFWIFFLYYSAWFLTRLRTESLLIEVNENITKIFFFIDSSKGLSITSIILGIFAHFSLILFIVLICFNSVTKPYAELVTSIWFWTGLSLMVLGEVTEAFIKLKRAETHREKRKFLADIVMLFCSGGVMIFMTVKRIIVMVKLLIR